MIISYSDPSKSELDCLHVIVSLSIVLSYQLIKLRSRGTVLRLFRSTPGVA